MSPAKPSRMPTVSMSKARSALRTTARSTALSPGASPPPVRMPIRRSARGRARALFVPSATARSSGAGRLQRRLARLDRGERDGDRGALTGHAAQAELGAVGAGDALDDGEPEAGAAAAGRVEGVEDPRLLVGRDADAVVADLEHHPRPLAAGGEAQLRLAAALLGGGERVLHQVEQQLAHLRPVDLHPRSLAAVLDLDPRVARLDLAGGDLELVLEQ